MQAKPHNPYTPKLHYVINHYISQQFHYQFPLKFHYQLQAQNHSVEKNVKSQPLLTPQTSCAL